MFFFFFKNFLLYEEKENQIENLSKLNIVRTVSITKLNINNSNFISNNIKNNGEVLELMDFGIVVSNASAKWTDTQTDNSLKNINLIVRPGRLVAIIGPVGAGKVNYNLLLQISSITEYKFNYRVH